MTLEVICGELRTGRILATSSPGTRTQWACGGAWSMVHREMGQLKIEVPWGSGIREVFPQLRTYLEPARCFAGVRVVETGQILEAGPIWVEDFSGSTGVSSYTALGLGSIFDRRRLVPVLAPGERIQQSIVSLRGMSYGTIAKRLVQLCLSHTGGQLPIVLPADETGAQERTYRAVELGNVWERLVQLMNIIGGPDIAFTPKMRDESHLEWVMQIGHPLLVQAGADWQFDSASGASAILAMDITRDARRLAMRGWAIGSGQDEEAVIGMAEDLHLVEASDFPLLEASTSRTSVTEQSTIDSHARSLVASSARPWQTWQLELSSESAPRVGDYRPGHWCQVLIPENHPRLTPGQYRTRILSISGGLGAGPVRVEMAPTMEAR